MRDLLHPKTCSLPRYWTIKFAELASLAPETTLVFSDPQWKTGASKLLVKRAIHIFKINITRQNAVLPKSNMFSLPLKIGPDTVNLIKRR